MMMEERYQIGNDGEGHVEVAARKADAFTLAQKWADKERVTYWVYDRMARPGNKRYWEFAPAVQSEPKGKPLVDIL